MTTPAIHGPREHLLKRGLRRIFRRVVSIYFRDAVMLGATPDASTRGRIFGANHVNGLVDPILIMTLTRTPISPIAKATLWKIPGLAWLLDTAGAVPIVRKKDDPAKKAEDNDAVFAKVAAHLAGGGNLLIFPEGVSHNEPGLAPLKTGAGRMLARAKAEGAVGLTYQAAGLSFDGRDTFRSRALVEFGDVRNVDDHVETGDALARAITDALKVDLESLVHVAATWEDLRLDARIAEMFADDEGSGAFGIHVGYAKRVHAARAALAADPASIAAIAGAVDAYFAHLERVGTTDLLVAKGQDVGPRRLARALAMVATLPLALFAAVVYFVPYQLPRGIARALRATPDVASTYKIGIGLVVFPIWGAILGALAWHRLAEPFALAAIALLLAGPLAALPWIDREARTGARLALLVPGSRARRELPGLREERARVRAMLEAARDRANA